MLNLLNIYLQIKINIYHIMKLKIVRIMVIITGLIGTKLFNRFMEGGTLFMLIILILIIPYVFAV